MSDLLTQRAVLCVQIGRGQACSQAAQRYIFLGDVVSCPFTQDTVLWVHTGCVISVARSARMRHAHVQLDGNAAHFYTGSASFSGIFCLFFVANEAFQQDGTDFKFNSGSVSWFSLDQPVHACALGQCARGQ